MPYFIQDEKLGLFVGEFLGLGFYQWHIQDGQCSDKEKPIPFNTEKEALDFLYSWAGGVPEGHTVVLITEGE